MGIIIKKLYNINSSSYIIFESVSDELILISLELKAESIDFDSRPFHYRYHFGDFPPLDISFDSETGLLKEITLFVRKSCLKQHTHVGEISMHSEKGYPCVNTDFLIMHEFYYDETCEMNVILNGSSLSISQSGSSSYKKVIVNENLIFLLDESEVIIGVVFNNLSSHNLDFLE